MPACHTAEQGGANKIGTEPFGIVNRPIASHEGFAYSAPMKEFSQGGSVVWDYDHLNHFLAGPKAYVKGTAMGFAGVKKDDERANLIAYLRTLADSPAPLPEPPAERRRQPLGRGRAAATDAAAKPAEGGAAAQPAAPARRSQPSRSRLNDEIVIRQDHEKAGFCPAFSLSGIEATSEPGEDRSS